MTLTPNQLNTQIAQLQARLNNPALLDADKKKLNDQIADLQRQVTAEHLGGQRELARTTAINKGQDGNAAVAEFDKLNKQVPSEPLTPDQTKP